MKRNRATEKCKQDREYVYKIYSEKTKRRLNGNSGEQAIIFWAANDELIFQLFNITHVIMATWSKKI